MPGKELSGEWGWAAQEVAEQRRDRVGGSWDFYREPGVGLRG